MALGTFSLLLWTGLDQLRGAPGSSHALVNPSLRPPLPVSTLSFSPDAGRGLRKLRHGAKGLVGIVALTAFSGLCVYVLYFVKRLYILVRIFLKQISSMGR